MKTVIIHLPFQHIHLLLQSSIQSPVRKDGSGFLFPHPASCDFTLWSLSHAMEQLGLFRLYVESKFFCVCAEIKKKKKKWEAPGALTVRNFFMCPVSCQTRHRPIISQSVVSCVNYQTQWWGTFQFCSNVCKLAIFFFFFFLIKPSAYSKGSRATVLDGSGVNLFPGGALRCPSSSGDSFSA